ncbi:MAG: FAD-dependent oxidoreductase [Kofleriaceae bacterium]|nr:FAD-dependent oxidoreductase [Kofleriaceae bacterium]
MTAVDVDVDVLVVGAGVSGLGFANWIAEAAAARGRARPTVLVAEAEAEVGGWCRTVRRDGFVWDYSGHFFHFKHPEIEAWLRARMPGQDVRTVARRSLIRFAGRDVDFPFQKNIHQLPRQDFIDCLVDLYFRDDAAAAAGAAPGSFKEMLYQRFGRSIAEKFLVPYNEKLYACDLDHLDRDAMGRFFPHADVADVIRNMRTPDNAGYNATFTYPAGGAIEYVRALVHDLPDGTIALGQRVVAIDPVARTAELDGAGGRRTVRWRRVVSSAPLPRLLASTGVAHDRAAFGWNQVLVFNLGFDRKGPRDVHWMYFPDRARSFYRVGWYDNILDGDRMSLYVEIGAAAGATLDVEAARRRVLADLAAEGIVTDHQLVAWHSVVLDPAYVHITQRSLAEHRRCADLLAASGIHTVGRYGGWTYCSIEDNLLETRALADELIGAI